jgi:hypothetical protein
MVSRILDLCSKKLVTMSEGHPWNGWVQEVSERPFENNDLTIDIEDKTYYVSRFRSFETGAFLEALMHVIKCWPCAKANLKWSGKEWGEYLETYFEMIRLWRKKTGQWLPDLLDLHEEAKQEEKQKTKRN